MSDDVRNALHAAAERAASDDLRAVDVARKHVEAAARARAGAYDYASSRAGGVGERDGAADAQGQSAGS